MSQATHIVSLRSRPSREMAGNKASSLILLRSMGFRIPESYIVTSSAFEEYRKGNSGIISDIKRNLERLPDLNYIARSSTNLEDSDNCTFAGQFLSISGIRGVKQLSDAVVSIWESTLKHKQGDYWQKNGMEVSSLKCAVILQEMIKPVLSGVSFSINPVNGSNEVIIEAVGGPGEDLMQKGLSPFRWRLKKGKIIESNSDNTYENIIKAIYESTLKIKKKTSENIDIEWVYNDHEIYYVQLRNITANKQVNVYSNKMAKEMLPGQIKPLVWSVNIEMVNSTWIDIISGITGPLDIKPANLARQFYFHTYFNVLELGKLFSEFGVPLSSLESTMLSESTSKHSFRPGLKTLRHSFRIIRFILSMARFEKFFNDEYRKLSYEYKNLSDELKEHFTPLKFDALFDEMMKKGKRLTYLNIIIPLLMRIYNTRFSKRLKKYDVDYDSLDFSIDFPELKGLSPLHDMAIIKSELRQLEKAGNNAYNCYGDLSKSPPSLELKNSIDKFINKYGHHSESGNDFSYPKWEEDPDYVLKMIRDFHAPEPVINKISFNSLSRQGSAVRKLGKLYNKTGKYKVYRETISSLYIFGYGLFRKLFLALAGEMLKKEYIAEKDDIFYLEKSEIDEWLKNPDAKNILFYSNLISHRKKEMKRTEGFVLPSVIYGEIPPVVEQDNILNMKGIASSSGTYSGIVKILKKREDFAKVVKGDVLIIPFSDVSWTPVLCKAGAIISESGGILSHCSIIAREMGIPALVGIENACTIKEGTKVTVDGLNGILTLHKYE